MKKIGIITLYGNSNYGNRLQNLAVQTILEKRGFRTDTIAFANSRLKRWIYSVKMLVKAMVSGNLRAKRTYRFQKFNRKYIRMRYLYQDSWRIPSSLVSQYQYFVTGSDQVWNVCMNSVGSNADLFFLNFCEDAKKVCISPSIGVSTIPEEFEERVREMLRGFRYLSCREKQGVEEINRITGRSCEWLIDPTLYISGEEWRKILSLKQGERSPYVFAFFIDGMSDELRKTVEEYASSGGYTIVNPSDPQSPFSSAGPIEFLELISNAHMVFTDSFHVTTFSVNFHVPFYVFNRNMVQNMSSRIESICEILGLSDRYVDQHKPFEIRESYRFDTADERLSAQRKKFSEYLDKCFGE